MTERIPYAFAEAGDKTTVPDESTGTEVSFENGWSSAYALASTETGYRYLDRSEHNYLWNAVTGNVKQWQDHNFPEHFTDVDYSIGTITRFSDVNYVRISGTGAVSDPSASSDYEEYITPLIATQTEVDTGTDTEKTVTPATLAGYTPGKFIHVDPVSVFSASTASVDQDIDLQSYMPDGGEAVFSFSFIFDTAGGTTASWAAISPSDDIPTWDADTHAEMIAQWMDSASRTYSSAGNLLKVSTTGIFRLHKEGGTHPLNIRLIGYRAY